MIGSFYRMTERQPVLPIPWTPLPRPVPKCTFGLITSAGLYQIGAEPPFNLERERAEPNWGDPSYRKIPLDISADEVGVAHLHTDGKAVTSDLNILLPIHRFQELVAQGQVGGIAPHAYSFMGYQGLPPDTSEWEARGVPEIADSFNQSGVDCILLTPS
jgi:D-proline reductase (dithiol) PrdB